MYQFPVLNVENVFHKMRKILQVLSSIWLMFITYFPGPMGFDLRHKFWRKKFKYLGKNVKIETGVYFQNPSYIFIDDNCWIDMNVIILAGLDNSEREKIYIRNKEFKGEPGAVYIRKNVHIGPGCIISGISAGVYISDNCSLAAKCKVYAFSHHYRSIKDPKNTKVNFSPLVSQDRQCIIEGPVYLGSNTGAALHTVILPGVSIPDDCFIMINSVVSPGDYKSNSIISGDPAKRVGERFKSDE